VRASPTSSEGTSSRAALAFIAKWKAAMTAARQKVRTRPYAQFHQWHIVQGHVCRCCVGSNVGCMCSFTGHFCAQLASTLNHLYEVDIVNPTSQRTMNQKAGVCMAVANICRRQRSSLAWTSSTSRSRPTRSCC
jgi:hypothetical protein